MHSLGGARSRQNVMGTSPWLSCQPCTQQRDQMHRKRRSIFALRALKRPSFDGMQMAACAGLHMRQVRASRVQTAALAFLRRQACGRTPKVP